MSSDQQQSIPHGAPSPFQQAMRRWGHRLSPVKRNRTLASVLLRLAGGKRRQGFDVTIFETEKARLHPFNNISEKRVYITPQFWDAEERELLQEFINDHDREEIVFLDVGANAGLYSLYVLAACKKAGKLPKIVAIEPDPLMRGRMVHNFDASDAGSFVTILPWAITGEAQQVVLQINDKNRGMNQIAKSGGDGISVPGHPLKDVAEKAGLTLVDVMKVDIEGAEYPAFKSFFIESNKALFPTMIIMETSHDDAETSALGLCLKAGYDVIWQNHRNSVLRRK